MEAFVVTETAGHWAHGVELQMPTGAPAKIDARVDSVVCLRPGTCAAVGNYRDEVTNQIHVIAASEANGHWRQARVPPLPSNSAPSGANANLTSLSCTAPGNCVAVGYYTDNATHVQAMVVTERRGHWGQATQVVLPTNAAAGPRSLIAVACPRPGSCVAVGQYVNKIGNFVPMGIVQRNGHWPRATPIKPPSNAPGAFTEINSLSCTGTGKCVAVGGYFPSTTSHPLSVTESGGHWTAATLIRARPSGAVSPVLRGVSCTGIGSCVAVGDYNNASGAQLPYSLIRSASGKWSTAVTVRLPVGALTGASEFAALSAVSCVNGRCVAAGYYRTAIGGLSGMAATRP
jgi:hypothetical protein